MLVATIDMPDAAILAMVIDKCRCTQKQTNKRFDIQSKISGPLFRRDGYYSG